MKNNNQIISIRILINLLKIQSNGSLHPSSLKSKIKLAYTTVLVFQFQFSITKQFCIKEPQKSLQYGKSMKQQ